MSLDTAAFFAMIRASILGPTLSQDEVDGCEAILETFKGQPMTWCAYALATAYHETAGTMRPIREYGRGRGRKYGVPIARHGGQIAYGRGFVQLTWPENYERADKELGLNGALIKDYDLALRDDIAAQILKRGMIEGWFTGRRFSDYLPEAGAASTTRFEQARRIINGTDRAILIAGHANKFQGALIAGDWQ